MRQGNQPYLLVVDDDPKILALLERGLRFEGFEVHTADCGQASLEAWRQHDFDLVILDVMLPDMDGFQVCRALRTMTDAPILMLTARDDVSDKVYGLDAGADDYLAKPFAFEELLARIRALLRRSLRSSQKEQTAELTFADLVLNPRSREVYRNGKPIDLTTTEYDLLLYFMQNPRQVLSREQLFERIWGHDFSGHSNVLDVYIGYLRHKLESGGQKRLIHTVRGIGYILKEQG